MNVLYRAHATASHGGRTGHTETDDGKVSFDLSMPKALGGDDGPGTNPEQLFASGYAACYLSALNLVARQGKIALSADTKVASTVGIGPNDAGEGFKLDIDLTLSGTGLAMDEALALAEAAHRVCPYSNATRGNVDVRLHVEP
jgi:lipoyl-dependent peroxiredoxin